jgi:putative transposase
VARKRKKHADEFKAKVALEAVRGVHTLGELSSRYKVHPTVIAQWKRKLVEGAAGVFQNGNGDAARSVDDATAPLYEEIGRLKMEVDWLKKKL